jgi:hypothetical protein
MNYFSKVVRIVVVMLSVFSFLKVEAQVTPKVVKNF